MILYDAGLLTRRYTQHALHPYIDSEINNIRHYIEIQFVNKGIDFELTQHFKDKSFISYILILKIRKHPLFVIGTINLFVVIYYFNKLVTGLDIETTTPYS